MSTIDGTLHGLKIIDLDRVLSGPYCTQTLAGCGMQVIKLEPPVGDEACTWGPPFDASDTAWYFNGVSRSRLGISIDLVYEEGHAVLWQLLEDTNVLIENFKPGTLARQGMDFERGLQPRLPRLIHCAVPGFSPDSPLGGLPGYGVTIQTMAGLMDVNGEHDDGPMRVGLPIVDMVAGLNALIGILLALAERGKSGRRQSIDIALYDCGISLLHPHLPSYFGSGKVPQRGGSAHPNIVPYGSYQTGTAPIFLAVSNNRQFARLCTHVGAAGLAQDARFADNRGRCAYRMELKVALEAQLARFDCETLTQDLIHNGVPCGPVLGVGVVARHPHTLHQQVVVELSKYHETDSPVKLSRTPTTCRNAPLALDADTNAVLMSLGIDADARRRLFQASILE